MVKSDEDNLIASAVGKHAFYVYDCAHLNLVYMSKPLPEEILHIEATQDGFIYTALESSEGKNSIICWKKMHKVMEFVGHKNRIIKFITAGEFIFSLAEDGEFIVFNRQKGTIAKQMKFETNFDNIIHPNTYVNKLLFSCSEAN